MFGYVPAPIAAPVSVSIVTIGGFMISVDLRKIYSFLPLEPAPDPNHLPAAGDLYYECLDCSVVLSSTPHIKCQCTCGNLTGGAGKTKIERPERVRVVKGKLK